MKNSGTIALKHVHLLKGCRKGDKKAQMQIYKLYYKAMYNTSLQIVGDEMEAEDIMQEAFLTAFENLKSTELNTSFGGWLKRIVINKSLDHVRKRKIHFEEVERLPDPEDNESYDYNQVEETTLQVKRIREAMAKLPEKYKVVLSLSLLEGYDHDEIGEILGIPASTSRAQLSRGKKKLIEYLQSEYAKQ